MKRHFVILVAALLMFGVDRAAAQFDFGVVGGMNLTKADFREPVGHNFSSSNRCGWFIGPKLEFTVPLIGIGFDLSAQYSQRYINGSDNGMEKTKALKTIEIPVNLRYQIGKPSIVAAFVTTGPQFGFNVGSSEMSSFWSSDTYKIKNSMLSWNIGLGIKVLRHFEVGAGYNIALSKFAKITGTRESVKSNSFQAHVGYFF
ncbi:MAG: outer membrane beta-barrel protein [Bacteroidaceae bacterium]